MLGMHAVAAAPLGGLLGSSGLAMAITATITATASRIRLAYRDTSFTVSAAAERIRGIPKDFTHAASVTASKIGDALRNVTVSVAASANYLRGMTREIVFSVTALGVALVETSFEKMITALVYTGGVAEKSVSLIRSATVSVSMGLSRVWQIPKTVTLALTATAERYRVYIFQALLTVTSPAVGITRNLVKIIQAAYAYLSSSAGWNDLRIPMTIEAGAMTEAVISVRRSLRMDAVATAVTSAAISFYNTIQHMTRTATASVSAVVDFLATLRLTISATVATGVEVGRSVDRFISVSVITAVELARSFDRFVSAYATTAVEYLRQIFIAPPPASINQTVTLSSHIGTPITGASSRVMTVLDEPRSMTVPPESRSMTVYGDNRTMNA